MVKTPTNTPGTPTQSRHSTPPPNPNDLHEAMKREQARREAETQAKRAEQARQKYQAEQKERERQEKQNSNTTGNQTTDTRTPAEILGLKDGWTPEDLKTAYKREAGRTHPDKWIGKPESIRQAMEAEYKNIQEAYRKLKNTG